MPRQLILDLPVRPARGRADFFVSSANEAAVAAVAQWPGWPGGKLFLAGPPGAGKTHLAHVWAARSDAVILQAAALTAAHLQGVPAPCLAIEDIDRVLGDPAAEERLFHLHNAVLGAGGQLLLTAQAAPALLHFSLPDLQSRAMGTALAQLLPPDDALLAALLVKLFADRQLTVQPQLIAACLARMERSFQAAVDLVAQIDALALAESSPPNLRIARRILDKLAPGGA